MEKELAEKLEKFFSTPSTDENIAHEIGWKRKNETLDFLGEDTVKELLKAGKLVYFRPRWVISKTIWFVRLHGDWRNDNKVACKYCDGSGDYGYVSSYGHRRCLHCDGFGYLLLNDIDAANYAQKEMFKGRLIWKKGAKKIKTAEELQEWKSRNGNGEE